MRVWQANLGRNVSTEEFIRNMNRVLHAAGPRALICFQEIDEADRPEEMDYLVSTVKDTHRIVGKQTAVPILVPRHIELTYSRQSIACKGVAGYTPNRPLNQAGLGLTRDLNAMWLNFHMPILRRQTIGRRMDVRRAVRKEARKWGVGGWTADTNTHRGWPRIVENEKSVIDAGIDKSKAWGGEGRRLVITERHEIVNMSIDGHNAHGARLWWEAA